MKLYDGGKIAVGLVVFVVLACLPLWYNFASGKEAARAEVELPDPEKYSTCVAPTEYMRASHMELLNEWRDSVVRKGERVYVAFDGAKYEMSLSHTCMGCHSSREKFCSRCHGFMDVDPYCWDCHVEPREIEQ